MATNNTEIPFQPSTIETIDYSIFNWLNNEIDLQTDTNKGFKKVPVIWLSAERAYQIKNNVDLRSQSGVMTLPLVTIERVSMTKPVRNKGSVIGNVFPVSDEKGGAIVIAKKLNQYKTSNYVNADMKRANYSATRQKSPTRSQKKGVMFAYKKKEQKTVYETITIPVPVYVEVTYTIRLRAEFQQQLNQMMTPFITRPNGINYVHLAHEQHGFEGFIDEAFSHENNVSALGEEERKYETNLQMRVLGYLIGDDKNSETPKLVKRQTFATVRFPREHIMLGDPHDYTLADPSDPFYKE